MKKLIIFGNGEMADISNYYFLKKRSVDFFCVDDNIINKENFLGKPVISISDLNNFSSNEYIFFIALAYKKLNQIREKKYNEIKKLGFKFENFIHENSYIADNVKIGDNCFILENQTIQTKVEIGNNIILWSSNHIGHSSIIGSHSYLSSHITISGNCKIGERCFFGVNSAVKDNCIIGNDVFVGMGSIITNDLKNDSTTLNSSTKIYESDSKINRLLKKKFFNF
tara:strand:+ start:1653 stop:2327 length:675 start_codon:yes stop_codon:yes gene_type:complete